MAKPPVTRIRPLTRAQRQRLEALRVEYREDRAAGVLTRGEYLDDMRVNAAKQRELRAELEQVDGPPLRLRLLGEDLIAFRTGPHEVGLIQNACPHRGASLFFGSPLVGASEMPTPESSLGAPGLAVPGAVAPAGASAPGPVFLAQPAATESAIRATTERRELTAPPR